MVELFSGIDSLYMSGTASELPTALLTDLERFRTEASAVREAIPLDIGPAVFEVASSGFGRHRYRLDHANGVLGVSDSQNLPTFRIQPRASHLHAIGPAAVVAWWTNVLDSVAADVRLTASRLDVCADFHGLDFVPDERDNFLCTSSARDEYTRDSFSGWTWGAPGAILRARIYDKVADVKKKGADWVYGLWGERYDPARSAWRVEVQCLRQVLREYGVDTATSAIERAPAIFHSALSNFLTLRTATGDSNRSRWPIDPRWVAVAEPTFAFGAIGIERVRDGRWSGELRKVLPLLVGTMATAATALGVGLAEVCGPALQPLVLDYGLAMGKSFEDRQTERRLRIERSL